MGGLLSHEETSDISALGDFSDFDARIAQSMMKGPALGDVARMRGSVHCFPEPRALTELPKLVTLSSVPAFEHWMEGLLKFLGDGAADGFLLAYKEAAKGYPIESLEYDQTPLLKTIFAKTPLASKTAQCLACLNQGVMFAGFGRLQSSVWEPWMNTTDWMTDDWQVFLYFDDGVFTAVHYRTDTFRASHGRQPRASFTWALKVVLAPSGPAPELSLLSVAVSHAWWSRTSGQRAASLLSKVEAAWPRAETHRA
eukprot:TRINITY_DN11539_c0_g1_i1.p2 TRINITY_DN11539_c0_g1~~TRINITY_DN11539_c0_g1_i1.p2  ORF type:complete len:254 (+),score=81.12 TRINITY_DN11539_c0_g1_i1:140-901(+)